MKKHTDKIEMFLKSSGATYDEAELHVLMYEVVNEMKLDNVGINGVEEILGLMERYPLVNFGSPGALSHFMESFFEKGYEELLEESVQKTPSVHTIWLLNRIINAGDEKKSEEYIQIVKSICANSELPAKIVATAEDFLEYQEEI